MIDVVYCDESLNYYSLLEFWITNGARNCQLTIDAGQTTISLPKSTGTFNPLLFIFTIRAILVVRELHHQRVLAKVQSSETWFPNSKTGVRERWKHNRRQCMTTKFNKRLPKYSRFTMITTESNFINFHSKVTCIRRLYTTWHRSLFLDRTSADNSEFCFSSVGHWACRRWLAEPDCWGPDLKG